MRFNCIESSASLKQTKCPSKSPKGEEQLQHCLLKLSKIQFKHFHSHIYINSIKASLTFINNQTTPYGSSSQGSIFLLSTFTSQHRLPFSQQSTPPHFFIQLRHFTLHRKTLQRKIPKRPMGLSKNDVV